MRRIGYLALLSVLFASTIVVAQQQRHFTVTYRFTVNNVTPGAAIRVWFPMAHSNRFQTVKVLDIQGDLPVKQTVGSEYGNRIFYAEAKLSNQEEYAFEVTYDVIRLERRAFGDRSAAQLRPAAQSDLARLVRPDRLVPVTGEPARIAVEQTAGEVDPLSRARAIYDYVFRTMRYDKTGTGWGRGDALWACDAKRGNCTDFHSLFASMARSQGIPTRFEIGLPLPADHTDGEIPGYHCWSDFYVAGKGWIPIDISEAWKNPDKKDYFFGSHDVNRVEFSVGRDITLSPKQTGEPLNYFIYPYVEVNGKKYEQVDTRFSFADVRTPATNVGGK